MVNSRNKILLLLTILYSFLGQPFLFSALYLGGKQFSLKLLILLFMGGLTFIEKKVIPSRVKIVFLVVSIFYVLSGICNFEFITNTLFLFFDVIFFYLVLINFLNDLWFRTYLYRINMLLVILIAVSTISLFFVLIYDPSYFVILEVADYPVFYNRFLGMISSYNFRPHWYFAEPSYCGFYLGVNFFIFFNSDFKSIFIRYIFLSLIIVGLVVTASLGSYIYIILALLMYLGVKLRINNILLQGSFYFLILFAIFILPQFDIYKLNQNFVDVDKTSFDDRQYRLNLSSKMYEDMSVTDYIFGSGVGAAEERYDYGISDAYNKLIYEQGTLYMILFLLFVRKFTKANIYAHTFILLSYLSVIIYATPIVLIIYLCVFYQSKLKDNNQQLSLG
jgi:hypothetical protein